MAGTTIHELGHVLAGWEAGHGKEWHAACGRLGLRRIKAAGTSYCLANFAPDLRLAIAGLVRPDEGEPVSDLFGGAAGGLAIGKRKMGSIKPCTAAIGTRGGTSRGAGSGSRLRLWECEGSAGHKPVKVRVASDDFRATCDCCKTAFRLIVKGE